MLEKTHVVDGIEHPCKKNAYDTPDSPYAHCELCDWEDWQELDSFLDGFDDPNYPAEGYEEDEFYKGEANATNVPT